MSISIENIRSATPVEWDYIWQECSYSTYFHSREWAEIWNAYTNQKMRPQPKLVSFSDGKEALLPFSRRNGFKGLVKEYISSPAGTFGGWLSLDDLDSKHGILLSQHIQKKFKNIVWRLNPYDKLVFKTEVTIKKNDETHALNLRVGFDVIYKRWTKGHKSAAKKARREGISVKVASSVHDWLAYYKVYEDSLRRWGDKASSIYSWKIFEEILGRHSPHIKLWLAFYQEKIIAGALCFYAKKHVVYWHGAALAQYFNLRPSNLLIFEIIKHTCDKGYTWFDFNPSGGHEGVRAFKKSFGAEALACPVVGLESGSTRLAKKFVRVARRMKLREFYS